MSDQYKRHLQKIAVDHQIHVLEVTDLQRHEGVACIALRAMLLPQIQDASSYAVGLHEFGHFLAPYGHGISQGTHGDPRDPVHVRQMLTEEYAAWEWAEAAAKAEGIEWTLEMEHTKCLSLQSYQQQLQRVLARQERTQIAEVA